MTAVAAVFAAVFAGAAVGLAGRCWRADRPPSRAGRGPAARRRAALRRRRSAEPPARPGRRGLPAALEAMAQSLRSGCSVPRRPRWPPPSAHRRWSPTRPQLGRRARCRCAPPAPPSTSGRPARPLPGVDSGRPPPSRQQPRRRIDGPRRSTVWRPRCASASELAGRRPVARHPGPTVGCGAGGGPSRVRGAARRARRRRCRVRGRHASAGSCLAPGSASTSPAGLWMRRICRSGPVTPVWPGRRRWPSVSVVVAWVAARRAGQPRTSRSCAQPASGCPPAMFARRCRGAPRARRPPSPAEVARPWSGRPRSRRPLRAGRRRRAQRSPGARRGRRPGTAAAAARPRRSRPAGGRAASGPPTRWPCCPIGSGSRCARS